MEWEPDWNLRVRMGVAVLLVVALPFAFVGSFVWLLETAIPAAIAELSGGPVWDGIHVDPVPLLVVVFTALAVQYVFADSLVLRSVGARRVDPKEYPSLDAALTRLSGQVDLPKPDLAVADTVVPNAFVAGRSPSDATVVVTTGLLETLSDAERDAVLAHELSHVKNRDAVVMSVASLMPTLTYLVATLSFAGLGVIWEVAGEMEDSGDAKFAAVFAVTFGLTALLTLTVSAFFWVGSFLLFRLLSRYREHAADHGAARITGDPLALASALETLDDEMAVLPDRDLREYDGAVEALSVSPLDAPVFTDDDRALVSRDVFPETHPSTEQRIERLRSLDRQLERQ